MISKKSFKSDENTQSGEERQPRRDDTAKSNADSSYREFARDKRERSYNSERNNNSGRRSGGNYKNNNYQRRDDADGNEGGERRSYNRPAQENRSYSERGRSGGYNGNRNGDERGGGNRSYNQGNNRGDNQRRSYNPNFTNDNRLRDSERNVDGNRTEGYNSERNGQRKNYDRQEQEGRNNSGGERGNYDNNRNKDGERGYGNRNRQDHPSSGGYRSHDNNERNSEGGYRQSGGGDRSRGYNNKGRQHGGGKGGNRSEKYPSYASRDNTYSMRLNRYISMSGICSRREADDYIRAGVVTVNGNVVTEMGTKVNPGDVIRFNDEVLRNENKVYILMNKPKGYVTSIDDPHADKTVMELLKGACNERVYPVGRLDKNSLGVLLITNDGEVTKRLTHPSYEKKKVYQVSLDKPLTRADMDKIVEGIELEDGLIFADAVSYVGESKSEIGIEIHSGRNRIVRRIFEHLGHRVNKLDRVYFAGLTKKNLKRGQWRFLTRQEVEMLRTGMYE